MIEGLKPYAEYKESGLPWLDSVPKHWDMAPNRALMRDQRQVVGARASDYTLLSLTLRGVIARDMVNPKGKFPAQFNTYKVVKPDDFVFCLFDIDETPRGVGLSPLKGMITGAYDIFSPTHRINPRFLYHYYLFVDEGKLMKPLYTGLRKTIQRGVFASLKAPLPPPDEQTAIVRFLDHANRKIDGFIRAKRKLIGLLNEQKQAIIHRAVTRGLHPDVPLKPSGIPWLGDIPLNFSRTRLGRVCSSIRDGTHNPPPAVPGIHRLLSVRNIIGGRFVTRSDDRTMTAAAFTELQRSYTVEVGDVVVAIVGATTGKAAVVEAMENVTVQRSLAILRPTRTLIDSKFLNLLFASRVIQDQIKGIMAKYAAQPGIYLSELGRLQVTYPSLHVQTQIVGQVETDCIPMNAAIARTEREIALMQEYRTRLTADIVTGKLDVREAAAKLPDLPADATTEPVAEDSIEDIEIEEIA